ncbi:hypothetical protein [Brucella sp. 2716]|uniref:hypothetical protein n=1 Tax=Brucella sp. 2716 TaxID=2975052 RepID=UPI00217D7919|nr:hypothetical protein [Brucella sp. 2716]UWF59797.1 hypothetical protein NYO66_04610 [Brucella sp. 2716]
MQDDEGFRSIGWVAISKTDPKHFGGHKARCKVYDGRQRAIACQRGYRQTDEDVLRRFHISEVFVMIGDE